MLYCIVQYYEIVTISVNIFKDICMDERPLQSFLPEQLNSLVYGMGVNIDSFDCAPYASKESEISPNTAPHLKNLEWLFSTKGDKLL